MGELTFDGIQFCINGEPINIRDIACGKIPKLGLTEAERYAKLKSEMDAMREKYKPIADKLVQEIHESFAPTPLSEDTAHEPRKHYKPKFTL